MHSFTGNDEMAAECVALGLHLSFAGMLTYKKSQELREVLRGSTEATQDDMSLEAEAKLELAEDAGMNIDAQIEDIGFESAVDARETLLPRRRVGHVFVVVARCVVAREPAVDTEPGVEQVEDGGDVAFARRCRNGLHRSDARFGSGPGRLENRKRSAFA